MTFYDFTSTSEQTGFKTISFEVYKGLFKRSCDIAAVLIMALPILIVICVFALLIARDGKSPFYVQKRVGRAGREFRMIKLRSMVPDADQLLSKLIAANPEAKAEWEDMQKLTDDPRITPIGQFIRKTSIDELPQLWNVLVGDMSLVGPRPMMPDQKSIYPGSAYYDMRPGVTGLWQVSERNEANFQQRACYDEIYAEELSFSNDVRIMFQTVNVVLTATGK